MTTARNGRVPPEPPGLAIILPMYLFNSVDFTMSLLCRVTEAHSAGISIVLSHRKAVSLPDACNQMVTELLASPQPWQRLLCIEQDMVLPPGALIRHARLAEPVVGSLYFGHGVWFDPLPPYQPLAGFGGLERDEDGDLLFRLPIPSEVLGWIDRPGLHPVDWVGMGCTSIRRDVLERWDAPKLWFQNAAGAGHDMNFCIKARHQGWGVFVDSASTCRHLTEVHIGPEHYRRALVEMAQHHLKRERAAALHPSPSSPPLTEDPR